ncbi:MAG: hypothetical protein L7F78_15500 [Syntrophales bacterium LBB04]|nr:hypothetical protein [Syntrophales bacterium LBB04]
MSPPSSFAFHAEKTTHVNNLDGRIDLADSADEINAAYVGHENVGEDKIRFEVPVYFVTRIPVDGHPDVEALHGEDVAKGVLVAEFILYNENLPPVFRLFMVAVLDDFDEFLVRQRVDDVGNLVDALRFFRTGWCPVLD